MHGRLTGAAGELHAEEHRLAEEHGRLAADLARHAQGEAECLRELARARLDALAAGAAAERLDAAESEAMRALDERAARLAEIDARVADAENAIRQAEADRDAALDRLEAAEDALEEMTTGTEARLADDAAWADASKALAKAEERAAAADAKADTAEADRAEKSAAYDADPLFRYLWERGYGTGDYAAMSIVREIDGRVARLIDYRAARLDYHRLHEIPRRLRAHAERLASEAEEARAVLARLERDALVADGVEPLEAAVAEAEAAVDAAEAELDARETAREAAATERAALADPASDTGLARALDGLADTLREESLMRLAEEARATPGPEDDRLVRRLGELRDLRELATRELEANRDAMSRIAQRRTALEAEARRLRRRGQDRGGGFANSELLGELIRGVVAGAMSSGALGDALSDGFRPRRRRSSRIARSVRLPSRPSRGGGGFRTGGGF